MKKLRIAIIAAGDFSDRKGLVNAVLSRVEYLKKIADYEIDVFSIQTYYGWLARQLRPTAKTIRRVDYLQIENLKVRIFWKKFSLLNYILSYRFHIKGMCDKSFYDSIVDLFKDYSLISIHGYEGGQLALRIKFKYGIPFVASWYGSDIHTIPYVSNDKMANTVRQLEQASENFFVSKKLLEMSDVLTKNAHKLVLCNGIRNGFEKFSKEEKRRLRRKYNIESKKIVAFAGNLIDMKNASSLPDIFNYVHNQIAEGVEYWVIGNGVLREDIEKRCSLNNIPVKMWGYVPDELMPSIMNCIDVIVLPSKKEGNGMVLLEAIACGANAVGSRIGGIPEVLGEENTFELCDRFASNIANRIVFMLTHNYQQKILPCFSWERSASIENNIIKAIIGK